MTRLIASVPGASAFVLLVTTSLLAVLMAVAAHADVQILSAESALNRMEDGTLVVLDIRTPQEWAESGVAKGAWPVSMHVRDFPQRLQQILGAYPTDQIGLICATGGRSAYVAKILERNGYSGIVDVSEGMEGNPSGPGWIARKLPIQDAATAKAAYEAALRKF